MPLRSSAADIGAQNFADVLLACGRGLVYLACDLLVLLRKAVLHAEILQFGLDGIESETVCQRREEVDRLAGDLDLLVRACDPAYACYADGRRSINYDASSESVSGFAIEKINTST